ncbi:MFS transporter [Planosporangium flavigriseum]|uniref:MFS transporter n=1 Tax=Planosporangium flavigriseum TaxID=373681 RepID=A0A8J3LRP0_9ACTN|nr:MFS transporter [Planosporangium flavigriseum]NJC65481.1 MFS transporter [Planosporangium flavigriseum]GIG76394.1 MFS transporter [Planosporangium flavigriseum]
MQPAVAVRAWAPLRRRTFRDLYFAQFATITGGWAQTVGAQWLMGDLGVGPLFVALVQTANTLPIFALVVPAGALGDIVDRRRLLIAGQSVMCAAAAALTLLTAARLVNPPLLLLLIALIGVGGALSITTFQAVTPELVSPEEIPQAAYLGGANANLAAAVGPALGGALIATIGPVSTFAFNTLSFLGVLLVLYRWKRPPDHRPLGAEHIVGAVRAGVRYTRHAPRFATVLARLALFVLFASALWALLPALARGPLRLSAGGYGLLLACLGLGAAAGAFIVPRIRARVGTNAVVTGATLTFAAMMAVIGLSRSPLPAVVALVVSGAAWIGVLSTLNGTAQVLLPAWTRARALAYYQVAFMGGQALGAFGWGTVADLAGVRTAFVVPAAGLVVAAAVSMRALHLPEPRLDVSTIAHWPEPPALDVDSRAGPVLVTLEWPVPPENADAFVKVMRQVSRSRKRTGGTNWGLFRDAEDPTLFLETFTVATWHEHLRQHLERGTVWERNLEAEARSLLIDGAEPRIRHLIWAEALKHKPELRPVRPTAAD